MIDIKQFCMVENSGAKSVWSNIKIRRVTRSESGTSEKTGNGHIANSVPIFGANNIYQWRSSLACQILQLIFRKNPAFRSFYYTNSGEIGQSLLFQHRYSLQQKLLHNKKLYIINLYINQLCYVNCIKKISVLQSLKILEIFSAQFFLFAIIIMTFGNIFTQMFLKSYINVLQTGFVPCPFTSVTWNGLTVEAY